MIINLETDGYVTKIGKGRHLTYQINLALRLQKQRLREKKLNRAEEAKKQFEKGFHCAPAVLSTYNEQLGLEKALALKIACGFGAGIGRMGKTCGAVTGALMVIGLKHGQANLADQESSQRTYALVKEFIDRFTTLHGSIECKELIGYDLSDSSELGSARDSGIFQNKCPGFVYDSALILEEILHLPQ